MISTSEPKNRIELMGEPPKIRTEIYSSEQHLTWCYNVISPSVEGYIAGSWERKRHQKSSRHTSIFMGWGISVKPCRWI